MERYRNARRFTLFSDIFRYHGLAQQRGIWCDTDVLLLRSLNDMGELILGWEDEKLVGNAVLLMPPDCPFIESMCQISTARVPLPIQWRPEQKLRQRLLGFIGKHKPLECLEWSIIGPKALTFYVRRSGLCPSPPDVFYPLPGDELRLALIPGLAVEDAFTEDTRAVHLWHSKWTFLSKLKPPKGSFLDRMCEKYLSPAALATQLTHNHK